jgi:hypothetical protein
MQIPVLIEPVAGNGYRARAGEPFGLTAEGPTCEEALAKLRAAINHRVTSGARLVQLELDTTVPPWAKFAGTWGEDDPLFEEWKQAVEEYRRQMDEDTNVP